MSDMSPTEQEKRLQAIGVDLDDGFEIEVRSAPTVSDPHDRWTIRVCLGRDSVILREPARGKIQIDTGRREAGSRRSIGTSDPAIAIARAKEVILTWRTEAPLEDGSEEMSGEDLTVGHVTRLLARTDLTTATTYSKYLRATRICEDIWGAVRALNTIGEPEIGQAMKRRMTGLPDLELGPVGAYTARKTFQDYYTCITHVCRLRDAENRVIWSRHPWSGVTIPRSVRVVEDGHSVMKQAEAKLRFPFPLALAKALLHSPGDGIPAPVDVVDPSGQLRMMVVIAVFMGRRAKTIRNLSLRDLGRTQSEVRRILNEANFIDPIHAPVFQHGVIRFPAGPDKQSLFHPAPIGRIVAMEIDRYLLKHEGSSPLLFPRPKDSSRPASYQTFFKVPWEDPKTGRVKIGRFSRALDLVEEQIRDSGEDPGSVVPRRHGDGIHRFRSTWATEMDRLGWGGSGKADRRASAQLHVDYMGGWSADLKGGQSARQSHYLELDPHWLQAIADWRPAHEVMRESQLDAGERVDDLIQGMMDSGE